MSSLSSFQYFASGGLQQMLSQRWIAVCLTYKSAWFIGQDKAPWAALLQEGGQTVPAW